MSPVLAAMKVPEETGLDALRFSLERFTTTDEIEGVGNQLGIHRQMTRRVSNYRRRPPIIRIAQVIF
jgi:cysteine sulfinate desulfinase/cysteine desulfurase-like protein